MKIILASKSPRRKELLATRFSEFDIITRDVDESLDCGIRCDEGVRILAIRKGAPIAREYPDALVISSDTLVEVDGTPLGKPTDEADAYRMLRMLSGRGHNVHTGVAVHYGGKVYSGVDTTCVHFRKMSDGDIYGYIATGEPMDKAGSYGIQGIGGMFVSSYDGDFDTVMGLSMRLVGELCDEALLRDD